MKWFALLFVVLAIYYPATESREVIRYVAVLFRHGDRTPVNPYPTDPWRNESLWPVRFGQLTNIGKEQHYALGEWLRLRYDNLISKNYDPTEIYVRSTDVDRTLMSAMVNLAGLYPPVGDAVWNRDLHWQPVPVHTVPQEDDEILSMNKPCPSYDIERDRVMNSAEYNRRLKKYTKLMEYLSANVGYDVKNYVDIMDIYSVLKIEKLYNFTLPDWTLKVFPDEMVEPAGYSFTLDTITPLMARLKIGPFLKEVIKNMAKIQHEDNSTIVLPNVDYEKGAPAWKFNMYSAHDLNIGSVLNGLGLYDGRCPEYTSTILFELVYDDDTQHHYIKILYRNTTEIVEPHALYIPNCGYRCPLARFAELYDNIIPNNWNEECKEPLALSLVLALSCVPLMIIFGSFYWNWSGSGQRKYQSPVRSPQLAGTTFHERLMRMMSA